MIGSLTFGVQPVVSESSRIQYRGIVRCNLEPIWMGGLRASFAEAHKDARNTLWHFRRAEEAGARETAVQYRRN